MLSIISMVSVHEKLLADIIYKRAPVKERVLKLSRPAFMYGYLQRAVYERRMLFNKYKNCRSTANLDNYSKQRNTVTKRKTVYESIFYERCAGRPESKDFWATIKPF